MDRSLKCVSFLKCLDEELFPLQAIGRDQFSPTNGEHALHREDFLGEGTLGGQDVGHQAEQGMTVVAVDGHVVLVVLERDQFLGQRNHHKPNALVLAQTHAGEDVDTILGAGVDAEVVAQLHTGDLGIIGEHPVDAVLQEADDIGIGNSHDHDVGAAELQLQSADNTLEVLTGTLKPFGNSDAVALIGQGFVLALDDEGIHAELVVPDAGSVADLLSLEGVQQEFLDLSILEVGQSGAHDIDVIGDHVDVLQSQSVSRILDGHGGVQTRAGLGHRPLNLLHTPNDVQRTGVVAVGGLATEADLGDLASGAHNGDGAVLEVHLTDQLVLEGLNQITLLVQHVIAHGALYEVVGADIQTDVHRNLMLNGGGVDHDNLEDDDALGQLHGVIASNDAGDVGGVDQVQVLAAADGDGILLDVEAGGGVHQAGHQIGVVEGLGQRILVAVHILQITTLESHLDDRSLGNLSHENVLPDAVDPLLLQEERVVGHDGSVASHNGLGSDGGQSVVQQLADALDVVLVEGSLGSRSIAVQRRVPHGLGEGVDEVILALGRTDDGR